MTLPEIDHVIFRQYRQALKARGRFDVEGKPQAILKPVSY